MGILALCSVFYTTIRFQKWVFEVMYVLFTSCKYPPISGLTELGVLCVHIYSEWKTFTDIGVPTVVGKAQAGSGSGCHYVFFGFS